MKKYSLIGMLLFLVASTVPSYGFIDYLFSGSASRDAIDNSFLGDLRAWWTGNPAYTFNPYWKGNQQANQQQGQQPNSMNQPSPQGYSPMGAPSPGTSPAPQPTVCVLSPAGGPTGRLRPRLRAAVSARVRWRASTVPASTAAIPSKPSAIRAGAPKLSDFSATPAISGSSGLSGRASVLSWRCAATTCSAAGVPDGGAAVSAGPFRLSISRSIELARACPVTSPTGQGFGHLRCWHPSKWGGSDDPVRQIGGSGCE